MNESEWSEGLTRLVNLFAPSRWTTDRGAEYFRILKHLKRSEWLQVVASACRRCERMPSAAELLKASMELRQGSKVTSSIGEGCEHCEGGRIFYETERNGQVYTKYSACDCADGDKVAVQISGLRTKMGRPNNPRAARYGWLMQRFGGLESTKEGMGLTLKRRREMNVPRWVTEE